MNALVWRLYRNQAYIADAALAALGTALLVTGITMTRDYHAFLARCAACSCGRADVQANVEAFTETRWVTMRSTPPAYPF